MRNHFNSQWKAGVKIPLPLCQPERPIRWSWHNAQIYRLCKLCTCFQIWYFPGFLFLLPVVVDFFSVGFFHSYASILGRINMWHFVEAKKASSEPHETIHHYASLSDIPIGNHMWLVGFAWRGWISCQPGPFFRWRRTWNATSGSGPIASMRRSVKSWDSWNSWCFSHVFSVSSCQSFSVSDPIWDCHFVTGSVGSRWTVAIGLILTWPMAKLSTFLD